MEEMTVMKGEAADERGKFLITIMKVMT